MTQVVKQENEVQPRGGTRSPLRSAGAPRPRWQNEKDKMNHVIYIDESGYTGADYINPDQPLFSLACNMFTNDDFEHLASSVFIGDKGAELKFSRLLGRQSGKKKLQT